MTPAGGASGLNTPFTSRSRSVSAENLASMDAVTSSNFAANVLQSRLNSLDVAGRTARDRSQHRVSRDESGDQGTVDSLRPDDGGTPHGSLPNSLPNGSNFTHSGGGSSQQSPGHGLSRQVSDEDDRQSGHVSPQHVEYSAETLAKVPSYSTALQSNPRTPVNEGLPSYQTATRVPLPSPPTAAHLH